MVCFGSANYSSFSDMLCLHSNLLIRLICVIHLVFYSNLVMGRCLAKKPVSFFHLSCMFGSWYHRWCDCKIVTIEKSATYPQLFQLLSYKPASKLIYQYQSYCDYPFEVLTLEVFFSVNFFARYTQITTCSHYLDKRKLSLTL